MSREVPPAPIEAESATCHFRQGFLPCPSVDADAVGCDGHSRAVRAAQAVDEDGLSPRVSRDRDEAVQFAVVGMPDLEANALVGEAHAPDQRRVGVEGAQTNDGLDPDAPQLAEPRSRRLCAAIESRAHPMQVGHSRQREAQRPVRVALGREARLGRNQVVRGARAAQQQGCHNRRERHAMRARSRRASATTPRRHASVASAALPNTKISHSATTVIAALDVVWRAARAMPIEARASIQAEKMSQLCASV